MLSSRRCSRTMGGAAAGVSSAGPMSWVMPRRTTSVYLPVLYWAWWDAHRNPEAGIRSAVEFHGRHLPAFQERLDGLLVDKAAAGKCRSGRHQTLPDADQARIGAVALAAAADAAQRGPDVIDVLLKT